MQAEGFSLLLTIKAIKAILYLERIFIGRKNMLPNSYKNHKRHSDKQSLAPVTMHVAHGRTALRGVLAFYNSQTQAEGYPEVGSGDFNTNKNE